jgi:hypothetical protein
LKDETEAQATALKAEGITFVPHGDEELSEILRGIHELVGDFFGRGWVDAFLGPEAAMALGMRLDGAEFARVRVLAAPLEPVQLVDCSRMEMHLYYSVSANRVYAVDGNGPHARNM